MPQLDLSTYSSQIFWLFVTFALMLTLSAKFLLPKMSAVLEKRWQLIGAKISESEALRSEADELSNSYEYDLSKSRRIAHDKILEASRAISVEINNKRQEFAKNSKKRFRKTELMILEKKSSAMGDVQAIAQDVVNHITFAILSLNPSSKDLEDAVNNSISSMVSNEF
jgi:F-type H+-transporting ATPase subunit b